MFQKNKYLDFFNIFRTQQAKGAKGEPKGIQRGTKGELTGATGEPKRSQRMSQRGTNSKSNGGQRRAKGGAKGEPTGS